MIRLQKLLAEAGLGSRRTVEAWIRAGRVSVGGRTAQLGDRASPTDEVCLDSRKLDLGREAGLPPELLLYYKPVGEVTGLGLSISYEIVKKHGGELRAESPATGGAVFTLRIPIERRVA